MNEDVFPIQHGGCFSNVMLVFRGVNLDLDLRKLDADGKFVTQKRFSPMVVKFMVMNPMGSQSVKHHQPLQNLNPDPSKMASF